MTAYKTANYSGEFENMFIVENNERPSDIDSSWNMKFSAFDPFADIPNQSYLPLKQLKEIHRKSLGPGNFAKRVCVKLFPELFTPEKLHLNYSYFGGGNLKKKELDQIRKIYLKRYVVYFHPELEDDVLWKAKAVTKINETLRRKKK